LTVANQPRSDYFETRFSPTVTIAAVFILGVTIVPQFSPNETFYIHREAPGAQLRSAESATRQKIPLKIRDNDRNYRPPIIA
jgi:hypothetical protein